MVVSASPCTASTGRFFSFAYGNSSGVRGPALGESAVHRSGYFCPRYQTAPPPAELPIRYVRFGSVLYSLATRSVTYRMSISLRSKSSLVAGAGAGPRPPPPPPARPPPPPPPAAAAGRGAGTILNGLL